MLQIVCLATRAVERLPYSCALVTNPSNHLLGVAGTSHEAAAAAVEHLPRHSHEKYKYFPFLIRFFFLSHSLLRQLYISFHLSLIVFPFAYQYSYSLLRSLQLFLLKQSDLTLLTSPSTSSCT